jgi:hypothetical protein
MDDVQFYMVLIAVVDGHLQAESQSVTWWSGIDRGRFVHRVTLQSAVPASGPEFDGRPYLGTDRTFTVGLIAGGKDYARQWPKGKEIDSDFVNANPILMRAAMRLVSFELRQEEVAPAVARAVFERAVDVEHFQVDDVVRVDGAGREGRVVAIVGNELTVHQKDGTMARASSGHVTLVSRP